MTECEFSVIKYVPDIVRFEPINIGIALLDKNNKQMHNKYVTNFNEFFKRAGVEKIHGLERSLENYKPLLEVDSTNYLWDLHGAFHGSVFYSEPIKVNAKEIDVTLQQVFDKMISIPENRGIIRETINVTKIKTSVKRYVEKLKFPENSCQKKYEITPIPRMPQIRDFAFVKDRELTNTIDVLNLSENNALASVKLFIYEIKAIIASGKYKLNQPCMFSTSPIEEETSPATKQSIEIVKMSDIPIIDPERQEEKIAEIREIIG